MLADCDFVGVWSWKSGLKLGKSHVIPVRYFDGELGVGMLV
jgi:hypothetical protein